MATNASDAGGAPADDKTGQQPGTEDEPGKAPDGQQPDDEGGEGGEGDDEPPTLEAVASEMGWVPKDKFTGPADQWKPADQFVRAGRDIQRSYANDIKRLTSQIDVMSRTTADILKDRLDEQRADLTRQYNEKVEEGDAAAAFKIGERINDLNARAAQPVASKEIPTTEGQEFAERHKSWFNVDKAATARAIAICNELAAQGVRDPEAQLRAAERTIRLEYPEHFQNQQNGQKGPASVAQPGGRGGQPGSRAKGFSDMPKAAQDVAKDMADRGVIPSTDHYVKNYWKNAEVKR